MTQPQVTLYWRPGCVYCIALRRRLDRRGVARTEVNIWEHRDAAAVVRSHAEGNETVPTVVVGERAMVNPSARQVVAALGPDWRPDPTRAATMFSLRRVLSSLTSWRRHA
jgi:mycoredoxin